MMVTLPGAQAFVYPVVRADVDCALPSWLRTIAAHHIPAPRYLNQHKGAEACGWILFQPMVPGKPHCTTYSDWCAQAGAAVEELSFGTSALGALEPWNLITTHVRAQAIQMDRRQAAAFAADTGGIEDGLQTFNLRGRPRSMGLGAGGPSLPPPTDNKEGEQIYLVVLVFGEAEAPSVGCGNWCDLWLCSISFPGAWAPHTTFL